MLADLSAVGDDALTVPFNVTVLADLSAVGDVALTVPFNVTMLANLSANGGGGGGEGGSSLLPINTGPGSHSGALVEATFSIVLFRNLIIIIIDNFFIALFSGVHKLTALNNSHHYNSELVFERVLKWD